VYNGDFTVMVSLHGAETLYPALASHQRILSRALPPPPLAVLSLFLASPPPR
jgi:hypothetical protein